MTNKEPDIHERVSKHDRVQMGINFDYVKSLMIKGGVSESSAQAMLLEVFKDGFKSGFEYGQDMAGLEAKLNDHHKKEF